MTKFSILTSVYVAHELKEKQLLRCQRSLRAQSMSDWEWILVNDGSPLNLPDVVKKTKVINQPHNERVIALSKAMAEATGEWFIFIDSDDEFMSYTLECISQMIEANPDYKMFNYGSIHVREKYNTVIRGPFEPKKNKSGHEVFGGGNIVNGTFVLHRSIYDDLGGFPPDAEIKDPAGKRDFLYMGNPWDFSVAYEL